MSEHDHNMTNEQLQALLSEKLREVNVHNADTTTARAVFNGAKALMKSVTIDIEGSKRLGKPLFERTKKFLGVK